MKDKSRRLRKIFENNISIFEIDADVVTDVMFPNKDNMIYYKYNYNIKEKKLSVFADVEAVYILFEKNYENQCH